MFMLCPCAMPPSRTACEDVKKMPVFFCKGLPMGDNLYSSKKSPSQMTRYIANKSKSKDYFPH